MAAMGLSAGSRGSERSTREIADVDPRAEFGRLAGAVAHDFNNLLAAIRGYADLLTASLPDGDPRRGDATEMHRAIERAGRLTRQLMDFGREGPPDLQVVDLNSVIADVEPMLRWLTRDIDLVTPADAPPRSVRADPSQLEQVLLNLVMNARDAMPEGGRLMITTDEVALADLPERREVTCGGPFIALSVEDTGTGMDNETLEHLFEPYFTTKRRRGTGLGLAAVHDIVTRSCGWIDVQSRPGRGTRLTIYLPAA